MFYWTGSEWSIISGAQGSDGKVLTFCNGKPQWGPCNTVTDIEGNTYHTVTIGTQTWMVENLKTTRLNDGTSLTYVNAGPQWGELTQPSYCWQYDNIGTRDIYGAYYNWNAVNSGKLAPDGWRIPTANDFNTLIAFLGGVDVAGPKLREDGTAHWLIDYNATNETGFSGLPGGEMCRGFPDSNFFWAIGKRGSWWTSTSLQPEYGVVTVFILEEMNQDPFLGTNAFIFDESDMKCGYTVRCIKE
jgi:uncharacterized protein (TIGR02145 family)